MTDPKALADALDRIPDDHLNLPASEAVREAIAFLRSLEDRGEPHYHSTRSADHCLVELPMTDFGKRVYVQEVG